MSRLSLEEAARRLGVSDDTLARALTGGAFPGRFLEGGQVFIPSSDLDGELEHWAVLESSTPTESRDTSWTRAEAEAFVRAALVRERAVILEELAGPLREQDGRLDELEQEVARVRRALVVASESEPEWTSSREQPRSSVRGLLQEISDLEALLVDLDG